MKLSGNFRTHEIVGIRSSSTVYISVQKGRHQDSQIHPLLAYKTTKIPSKYFKMLTICEKTIKEDTIDISIT